MSRRVWWHEELRGGTTAAGGRDGVPDGAPPPRPESIRFRLRMAVPDVDRFVADPHTEGELTGTIEAGSWGGPRPVEGGRFQLFVPRPDGGTAMRYRFAFDDPDGGRRTFVGIKRIGPRGPWRFWPDTTRMEVRILPGDVPAAAEDAVAPAATARMRITVPLFARQLTTFRGAVDGGAGPLGGVRALVRFQAHFVAALARSYRWRP